MLVEQQAMREFLTQRIGGEIEVDRTGAAFAKSPHGPGIPFDRAPHMG